ncbi:uncharacterized protein LOC108950545 [Ciona intestinalis]
MQGDIILINCIPPTSGISSIALAEIERVAKDKEELIGYLTLDEMKIRENVVIRDGMLVGFSELQPLSDKPTLASHIILIFQQIQYVFFLVFYVRTVKREVSIPLAWYPTNVTPAYQMAIIFWELLNECEKRGLQIHAVVADGMSVNRRFFKLVSGSSTIPLDQPFTAPNPHAPSRPIFLCSDPSHLLKTTRNSLLSSKPGGTRYMNMSGFDVLWTHVIDL